MLTKSILIVLSICLASAIASSNKSSEHQHHFSKEDVQEPNWGQKFPRINDRPIIGILTLPITDSLKRENKTRYFQANYVKFLQAPGARVVPVFHDLPTEQLEELLSKLNGMLLTGGGTNIIKPGTDFDLTPYGSSVQTIVNHSKKQLKQGKYFPIWGTCLGFESLHVISANTGKALGTSIAQYVNLTVKFSKGFRNSGMYKYFDPVLIKAIQKVPLTYNEHRQGVPVKFYEDQQLGLSKIFNVLTTSVDLNGQEIVTSISGKELPIYAVQYHPEKAQYDHYEGVNIPHDIRAIETSLNLANFFVFEARRNELKMTFEEATKVIIENYQMVVTDQYIGQVYLF